MALNGSQIIARALKQQSADVFFYIMGGPMMMAETETMAQGIRGVDVRHEQAAAMMAADDAAFLAAAQTCFGERLGRFGDLGVRGAWPLSRTLSTALTGARTLFIGNAAQALHPVAAQGFNLGLRDVDTLDTLLRRHPDDPGAADLLRRYAEARQPDRRRTADFTDQLVRLFSNRVPGLQGARHWGLLALDLLPPLKQAVMWQNLGYGGSR